MGFAIIVYTIYEIGSSKWVALAKLSGKVTRVTLFLATKKQGKRIHSSENLDILCCYMNLERSCTDVKQRNIFVALFPVCGVSSVVTGFRADPRIRTPSKENTLIEGCQ